MRVAIINITGGGMSGGYRKYLTNIIPRMALNPAVEALLCASPPSLNIKGLFNTLPNVEFVDCKPFQFFSYGPNLKLQQHLEEFSPDVIFVPAANFFSFNEVPIVSMVQNMEPLICPNEGNPVTEILRNWLRARETRKAVKKADRVIAISEFVRDFLIKSWGISAERIGVVYHGIDVSKKNDGVKPSSIPNGWERNFLFTAGSIRPARGLEDVHWAIKHLASQNTEIEGIVIAGEAAANMIPYQRKLKNWIEKHTLSSKVIWAGKLNENEMAWCYQNCRVFVMTSRVESFGLIALEAMSYGCICVAADNPCLPEIFSDTAIFYPPKDGKALAEAIQTVLAWDENQRKAASKRAIKRAADFSWDVCAEKTVAELKMAVQKFRRTKI